MRTLDVQVIPGSLLVVAVSVKQLPVGKGVSAASALSHDVVEFRQIFISEVQSAPGTFPFLPSQQGCYSLGQFGMSSEPGGPVDPVAVVGAFRPADLRMSDDGGLPVLIQAGTVSCC